MAVAIVVVAWVVVILSMTTILADPTSGSGEGPAPGMSVPRP